MNLTDPIIASSIEASDMIIAAIITCVGVVVAAGRASYA